MEKTGEKPKDLLKARILRQERIAKQVARKIANDAKRNGNKCWARTKGFTII